MSPLTAIVILALLTSLIQAEDIAPSQPHVLVNGSDVYGISQSLRKLDYWAFLGIRYGQAPVGNLRFAKPILEPLPAMINASAFGAHCYPALPDRTAKEDCLFLNIYTPVLSEPSNNSLPVIFYFHGGGNVMGKVEDKPDGGPLVVSGDVIVVTINYRLGPLGFLYTGLNDGVPGNMGLWDQNLALVWVTRYIEYFGGDPGRITLIGESAGGKDVSLHTVSPYSRPMVRRAVMESGTLYGPSLYPWDATEMAKRLAVAMCGNQSVNFIVQCLRGAPAYSLSARGALMWPDSHVWTVLDFGWGPVIDNDFIPYKQNFPGAFQGEVMLGVNNNEGTLLNDWRFGFLRYVTNGTEAQKELLKCDTYKSVFLKESLHQYFEEPPTCSALNAAYKFYIHCDVNGSVPLGEAMTVYADTQYLAPAIHYLQADVSTGNSYLYYFDHNVPRNEGKGEIFRGSHHAEDQRYIMGAPDVTGYTPEVAQKEQNLSNVLMTYLINFAHTGNPNSPLEVPVQFPMYKPKGQQEFLHINDAILDSQTAASLRDSVFLPQRMDLWLKELPDLMKKDTTCDGANGINGQTWGVLGLNLVFALLLSAYLSHVFGFVVRGL